MEVILPYLDTYLFLVLAQQIILTKLDYVLVSKGVASVTVLNKNLSFKLVQI